MRIPLVLILLLLLGFLLGGIAGLIVAAVLLAVGYLVSVRLNPWTAHRGCNGSGRSSGWIYTWTWHRCRGCGGSGRVVRYGAARWGTTSIRQEADRQARARDQAKQSGSWR